MIVITVRGLFYDKSINIELDEPNNDITLMDLINLIRNKFEINQFHVSATYKDNNKIFETDKKFRDKKLNLFSHVELTQKLIGGTMSNNEFPPKPQSSKILTNLINNNYRLKFN